MGAYLLEGGFHPPARDEPAEDHCGRRIQVCAEECCRRVLAGWIAHQHPADRHRRGAGMVPDRGAGGGEQFTLLGVVPLRDDHGRPNGLPAGQHGTQCRQATPLQRGTSALTLPAPRRRLEQGGIQPEPGDHTDVAAHRGQQFERCEAAVGDKDEQTVGQPAFGLQDRLPRPVGQRLASDASFPSTLRCEFALLCRLRCFSLHRADGARTVRNGSAQCRPDQLIGTTTISESQRSPLVLTKCPFEDRTGSR